jgi:hypothetical protein
MEKFTFIPASKFGNFCFDAFSEAIMEHKLGGLRKNKMCKEK